MAAKAKLGVVVNLAVVSVVTIVKHAAMVARWVEATACGAWGSRRWLAAGALLCAVFGCSEPTSKGSDDRLGVDGPAAAAAQPEPPPASTADQGVTNRGSGKANWWDKLPRPEWAELERLDDDSGWFEVYRVLPGVLAVYEPGQFEEVISYLILGEERALLFDTGLGIGDIQAVVEPLTELPVVVLNSHSHYDHIGGNHQFDFIYGQDHPFTTGRTAGLDHDTVAEAVAPGWIWKALPTGFEPAGFASKPWEIDEYVDEGSIIDLGGRQLEVLLTPGHSPDSLCLIDREARLLFVGDTFYPAPLYTHVSGSDFEAYRNSAHRLAAMAPVVDQLLPGHNVSPVGSEYLVRMANAFDTVADGGGEFVVTDGNREYQFDGFSIIVAESSTSE